jgi:hypothetical protein
MEELIGLIVFALIMRLLGGGRRAAPPPARRQPVPAGGERPPARPPVDQASGEQVFDLRELLREAFPAAVGPTRPAKVRPRRRPEAPVVPEQPTPAAVEVRPSRPAEGTVIRSVPPSLGFHDLGDPRIAARAVVLAEIFGAPRCRRPYRPPGTR